MDYYTVNTIWRICNSNYEWSDDWVSWDQQEHSLPLKKRKQMNMET